MKDFLIHLFECSLAISFACLVLLAITSGLDKRIASKWQYYSWIVLLAAFLVPVNIISNDSLFKINIPAQLINRSDIVIGTVGSTGESTVFNAGRDVMSEKITGVVNVGIKFNIYDLIFIFWLLIAIALIAVQLYRYRSFVASLKRWSTDASDTQAMAFIKAICAQMNIKRPPRVRYCHLIPTPMVVGAIRPVIYMPKMDFSNPELVLIVRHELTHYKRGDLLLKPFIVLVKSLHWFNPLIYMISKQVSLTCETSCDEIVLKGASISEREQYGCAILKVIAHKSGLKSSFVTGFSYNSTRQVKRRLENVMSPNKRWGGVLLIIAIITTLFSNAFIGVDFSSALKDDDGRLKMSNYLVLAPSGDDTILTINENKNLIYLDRSTFSGLIKEYNAAGIKGFESPTYNSKPVYMMLDKQYPTGYIMYISYLSILKNDDGIIIRVIRNMNNEIKYLEVLPDYEAQFMIDMIVTQSNSMVYLQEILNSMKAKEEAAA
ncbi:MAG TPA: M56 family metallopeptidase [Clostridia bacterium]|nr:M56 family metallopeptidase [Clostridia bacterium]